MERFSVKGRVAVVTGGAQGLGAAMAHALAQQGADIVIAEINLDLARKTARELEALGVRTLCLSCDVTQPDQVQRMVQDAVDRFGHIDILVNNAGIVRHIPAEEVSAQDWLDVINVNLNGVFFVAQAVGRQMIAQGAGNIINIASMSALIVNTPQCQASYNASKAGVIQLTKSLAAEWASHHIRVNAIAPGYMRTEMTKPFFEENGAWVRRWMDLSPMGRPGDPEELQGAVLYLASDASSFVTGEVIRVDGGYTVW